LFQCSKTLILFSISSVMILFSLKYYFKENNLSVVRLYVVWLCSRDCDSRQARLSEGGTCQEGRYEWMVCGRFVWYWLLYGLFLMSCRYAWQIQWVLEHCVFHCFSFYCNFIKNGVSDCLWHAVLSKYVSNWNPVISRMVSVTDYLYSQQYFWFMRC